MTNEAFSRVKIDAQLRDQGWEITNTSAVRFEYVLPDRTKADYGLCNRNLLGIHESPPSEVATGGSSSSCQMNSPAAKRMAL